MSQITCNCHPSRRREWQTCDLRHSLFASVVRIRFFCLARPKIQPLRSAAGRKSGTFGPLGKKDVFYIKKICWKRCKQDRSSRTPHVELDAILEHRFDVVLSGMWSRTKICLYLLLDHNLNKFLIDFIIILRSKLTQYWFDYVTNIIINTNESVPYQIFFFTVLSEYYYQFFLCPGILRVYLTKYL